MLFACPMFSQPYGQDACTPSCKRAMLQLIASARMCTFENMLWTLDRSSMCSLT